MSKVTKASKFARIDMGEAMIKALIVELGPKNFAIALSNANCHGQGFSDAGYDRALMNNDDVILNAWHKAVDQLISLGNQLEDL